MHTNEKTSGKKLIVSYKDNLYDLTEFIFKHPGGIKTLSGGNYNRIDANFNSINHSDSAQYLLNDYKISSRKDHDESMEHLVDWDLPMLPQISRLGEKYFKWVNSPVDRHLRLFENNFLENLSKTPWYMPILVWLPIIIFLVMNETSKFDESLEALLSTALYSAGGIFLWTFFEYCLHRYLFHLDVKRYPKLTTLHFLLHGLHHKVPFDENRLVFPPFPAAIIATVAYQLILLLHYSKLLMHPRLLLAGSLIGYLAYDMIHYYLHHGSPSSKSHFYYLKRYHYYHHFIEFNRGFGISSNMWDRLCGSEIVLKYLKYVLKWR